MTADWSRRRFLAWLGRTPPALALAGVLPPGALAAGQPRITPLAATRADTLSLAAGLAYHVVIREGDVINSRGEVFGTGNDYLQFFPLEGEDDGLLWVNHEYPVELFVNGKPGTEPKSRADVSRERMLVGGSIVHIRRDPESRRWTVQRDDRYNRRITAETPMPLVAPRPIAGGLTAIGTLANCGGGVTPWKTVLSCEENYDLFYGEVDYKTGEKRSTDDTRPLRWQEHFPLPPEHYGWVVEVDPFTGSAKKLTALGRFAHECATVREAADGRCVVYSGSDEKLGCLYKFIADAPGTLERGTLYVASLEARRWIPLSWAEQPTLKKTYHDQLEVLIRARDAGPLVGGSRLDRPEGIAIDPETNAVLVSFTNNTVRRNLFGSIVRIEETGGDPLALTFEYRTFLTGGPSTDFACPDNLAFDPRANLWFTTDVAGDDLHGDPYGAFANNGLYLVQSHGALAGKPLRMAAAPVEAELAGPLFVRGGRTLFLAVQHPGEESVSLDKPTSCWPDGPGHAPRAGVVAVEGSLLDRVSTTGDL